MRLRKLLSVIGLVGLLLSSMFTILGGLAEAAPAPLAGHSYHWNGETGSIGLFAGAPPTAVPDSGDGFTTDEETSFVTTNVLSNDTDMEGDPLFVDSFDTTATVGIVTSGTMTGTFNYDPNGQFESLAVGESTTDIFQYTVSDGSKTDTTTVTITINGVNDPPTANNDTGASFTTGENTPFTTGNVLSNDTDPDTNDTLSVQSIDTTATVGLVTNNGNGTFNYNPNGQFESLAVGQSITTSFVYTATDGHGGTDTATVTITINGANDPPTANDDTGAGFTTNEDTAFTTGNVLSNDTDPDTGDTLSVQSINTTGTVGSVTDNGNGTFNYNPNGLFESLAQGQSITTSFIYTVSDGNGGTDPATVTITITGVNDDPTDLSLSNNTVNENQAAGLTVGTFSTTDPDTSDTHTYTLVAGVGSDDNVSFDINGNVLETDAVLNALDSPYLIRVRTQDNNGLSRVEQFQIIVNDLLPAITVEKTATPSSVPETGANVDFTIRVINTSQENAVISIFSDSDFNLASLCPDAVTTQLNPGQQYTCNFTRFISGDFGGPDHQNTATAIVGDDEGNPKIAADTETVTLIDVLPDITVNMTANPSFVNDPGGDVTFTVEVTNHDTEQVTLDSLDDNVFGNLHGQGNCAANGSGIIAPNGGTYSCSFTKTINGTQGDPPHQNAVTAEASDDDGNDDSDSDGASVSILATIVFKKFLPGLRKPAPTVMSVLNTTTGSVTVIVRQIGTGTEITRCTVSSGATALCDHNGDNSHIFQPGVYNVAVSANCGSDVFTKTFNSGPDLTEVFCN